MRADRARSRFTLLSPRTTAAQRQWRECATLPPVSAVESPEEALVVGAIVYARVERVERYGAWLTVGSWRGLLQIPELDWFGGRSLSELTEGALVRVVVMALDPKQRRFSMSIKALQPRLDPAVLGARFIEGTVHHGVVRSVAEWGTFVCLAATVDAVIYEDPRRDWRSVGDEVCVLIERNAPPQIWGVEVDDDGWRKARRAWLRRG